MGVLSVVGKAQMVVLGNICWSCFCLGDLRIELDCSLLYRLIGVTMDVSHGLSRLMTIARPPQLRLQPQEAMDLRNLMITFMSAPFAREWSKQLVREKR